METDPLIHAFIFFAKWVRILNTENCVLAKMCDVTILKRVKHIRNSSNARGIQALKGIRINKIKQEILNYIRQLQDQVPLILKDTEC